jgi:hypothetical protein
MHSEPAAQILPPPIPLSYEQENKGNNFLDFVHPQHHHQPQQQQQQQQQLAEPLDCQSQQYSNFIGHPPPYQHATVDEQFYSTGRHVYPSYAYPYTLPPYSSLTIETGIDRIRFVCLIADYFMKF